jgi:hypothetical protein
MRLRSLERPARSLSHPVPAFNCDDSRSDRRKSQTPVASEMGFRPSSTSNSEERCAEKKQ